MLSPPPTLFLNVTVVVQGLSSDYSQVTGHPLLSLLVTVPERSWLRLTDDFTPPCAVVKPVIVSL